VEEGETSNLFRSMEKLKVIELFAGSRSIGKACDELGYECFSVDINQFGSIDLVKDIEFLTPEDIPFIPDIIWASVPCTTYSLAAISHHRNMDRSPKTELAAKSDRLVKNTIKLLKYWNKAKFYIENPRATLRKMPFMSWIPLETVWYCRYGDMRAKPTDIFSNNIRSLYNESGWQPRPQCFNNNPHCKHERAPRGSKTGTQGLKNDYERSKIPHELCLEILQA